MQETFMSKAAEDFVAAEVKEEFRMNKKQFIEVYGQKAWDKRLQNRIQMILDMEWWF